MLPRFASPPPLLTFGCLLFSFAAYNATRNSTFSLSFATLDAVAQPKTLILSSLPQFPRSSCTSSTPPSSLN